MKTKLVILGVFILSILGIQNINSQDVDGKTAIIKIKTSAQCGMCKSAIEKALANEKGVETAILDEKSKIVTVTYFPSKTNPEAIRKAISKIGYDADNVAADPKAYSKLASCCKKKK